MMTQDVERPTQCSNGGRPLSAETAHVLATAQTGRAVHIAVTDAKVIRQLRARFHQHAKRHDLRVHVWKDAEGIVAWCERS